MKSPHFNPGAQIQERNLASPEARYNELDSLRGLAAATVVIGHIAVLVFNAPAVAGSGWMHWRHIVELANRTPLTVLMAGGAAVRFFFVLSGFVLMLPYIRRNDNPYAPYIVKRICRIYLPYLAAVAVAVLGNGFLAGYPLPGWGGEVSQTWSVPVSGKVVLQHVLMLGIFPTARFNTALWSLVQEMRISIYYPLIALAVLRLSSRALLALVVAVEAFVAALPLFFPHIDMGLASFPAMLHWSNMFIVGAYMALHRDRIRAWMESHSSVRKAALGLFAFLIYSMGIKSVWGKQFGDHVMSRVAKLHFVAHWTTPAFLGYFNVWLGDCMAVFGAVVAICFALADRRTKAVLNHTLVLWTGRASYSLYLVHATVLFSLLYLLVGTKYLYLLAPLYFLLTIIVTAAFYRWVEVPTMHLGKALARRMTQPKPVTAEPEPSVAN
jgi:peptidoglycan/LPS O-acetylase OafA/YrhL